MKKMKEIKEMILEIKDAHFFSKSEATQLSILVDRVKDGKDDEAIQLAHGLAAEIALKVLAVQKFVGFLKGAKEQEKEKPQSADFASAIV